MRDHDQLHEELAALADHVAADGDALWAATQARIAGNERRRRLALATTTATVVAVVVALVAVLGGRDHHGKVAVLPTTVDTRPAPHGAIDVGADLAAIDAMAVDRARIWVAGATPDPAAANGLLLEVDAATHEVVSRTTLPGLPSSLVLTDDAVWLRTQTGETSAQVVEVDLHTHRVVATIDTRGTGMIGVAAGSVWASETTGELLRIDPRTARVAARIPVPPRSIGDSWVLSAGSVGVWVVSVASGDVIPIDVTTNRAGQPIHLAHTLAPITAQAAGALWIASTTQLLHVDAHGVESDSIGVVHALASDSDGVWAIGDDDRLVKILGNYDKVSPAPLLLPGASLLAVDFVGGGLYAARGHTIKNVAGSAASDPQFQQEHVPDATKFIAGLPDCIDVVDDADVVRGCILKSQLYADHAPDPLPVYGPGDTVVGYDLGAFGFVEPEIGRDPVALAQLRRCFAADQVARRRHDTSPVSPSCQALYDRNHMRLNQRTGKPLDSRFTP